MPGEGALSKIGIAHEATPGTPAVPSFCLPFVSADITPTQELVPSESIGGDGMVQDAGSGVKSAAGNIAQEFDAESSLHLFFYANTRNGYTAQGAMDEGILTAAPTGTAGGSSGVLPAGQYIYQVQLILRWIDPLQQVMPQASPASAAITVTSGQSVTLNWTDPSTVDLLDGFEVVGSAIFRSEVNGNAASARFIGSVSGNANTFVDTGVTGVGGSNRYADRNIKPVPATPFYGHLLKGATPPAGEPRLRSFTFQASKNVGSDELMAGGMVNTASIEISGAGDRVRSTFGLMGFGVALKDGEFSALAPAIKQQIMGHKVTAVVNDEVECKVQSFTFNLANNIQPQYGLCNKDSAQSLAPQGNRQATGTMTLIFQDRDLQGKSFEGEEIKLQMLLYGEPVLANGGTLSEVRHGVKAIPFPRIAILTLDRVKITSSTLR